MANRAKDISKGLELSRGVDLSRGKEESTKENVTDTSIIGTLGESTDKEKSKQGEKNKEALKLIEETPFLRPLLYVQDAQLYDEKPETEGYIQGKYVGTGLDRKFIRGEGDGFTDFLENSTITDIGFEGYSMYIVDNELGHYRVNDPKKDPRILDGLPPIKVSAKEVEKLARNVANKMEGNYNTANPIFDAELGYLRTNFVSSDVAPYGNTMALRISRPSLAIKNLADIATEEVDKLMAVFMRTKSNILISGSTGAGKSIRDSEKVPTPEGWKTHGDLKVGDIVYSRTGKPTKVIGVYPQGKLDVYRLTMSDGRTVDASAEHLWSVKCKGDTEYQVKTTQEILDEMRKGAEWVLPRARKMELESACQNLGTSPNVDIKDILKLDVKDDMSCIMVDNEEHLYLVGDYVVTHNTEYQKSLIGYIPQDNKITLMEDTLDSHIKEIYPEKDINSWRTLKNGDGNKVASNIDFHTLLRAALRNFPDWAMVSEVRGSEAGALLSVALSGHSVMTTMHTQGADSIPERLADMVSMGDSKMDYGALLRNILSVFKIGVHLERGVDPKTGKVIRYIREIYEYVDYDKDNGVIGYPIYRRYQKFNRQTGEYEVLKKHYRMSDEMLRRLEDNREYENVPLVFRQGEYEHKTLSDRKNIMKGEEG